MRPTSAFGPPRSTVHVDGLQRCCHHGTDPAVCASATRRADDAPLALLAAWSEDQSAGLAPLRAAVPESTVDELHGSQPVRAVGRGARRRRAERADRALRGPSRPVPSISVGVPAPGSSTGAGSSSGSGPIPSLPLEVQLCLGPLQVNCSD